MIKDRVENAMAYASLGPGIARAMQYLSHTDLSAIQPGEYDLDGRRIFAIVQEYQPKPLAEGAWESHHRYIDVQVVVRGTERMGYQSLLARPKVTKPYDPHTDLVFYEPGRDLLVFTPGEFAIFTPQDVHAPGLAVEGPDPGRVFKAVIKVRVDEKHPCGF
jgi:biofilm protein TabA